MASGARRQASRVLDAIGKAKDGVKTKIADETWKLVGISDRLKTSDQEWSALAEYVTQHVACVLAMRPSTSMDGDALNEQWNQLQLCVQRIGQACSARLERDTVASVAFGDADVQKIAGLRRVFDDAFSLFKLNLDLRNFTEGEKFLSSLNIDHLTQSIITRVKEDLLPQALEALPYASGASWDPTKGCLPGTRVEMIDQMWNFINAADGATCAQIFWLVDVAGSGKTAIAHSVCQKAHEAGLLVTSFFFDRMSAERNNAGKFVTTMARDLATRDKRIAREMAAALQRDVGLRSASVTRQFNDLISLPSVKALGERQQPHVFLLDGLDEGMAPEEQLTAILAHGVRGLPGNFRILVTSRPMSEIAYAFDDVDHIQKHTIHLRSISNQEDISTYVTYRLVEVASKRRRKLPWPDPSLALQLVKKSEGHFLWASTVTEFLGRATNPDRQLDALLSLKGASNTEAKMDQLYSAVLQTCPWGQDEDFLHGYHMYMGTVFAAKEPLTANAMQMLHGSTHPPRNIFEMLGSLLTGFDVEGEVVRLLHLSLQEYVTVRAPSPYHLVKKDHSATLAVLCLRVVNVELASDIPALDTFSLDDATEAKIPEINPGMISEPLHYACRFWPVHMWDVVILSTDLKESLQHLLSTHVFRWIKVCVCLGQYTSLRNIRDWLHMIAPDDDMLSGQLYARQLAFNLTDIAWRLRRSGRREEALSAAEDAVVTARHNLTVEVGMLQLGQEANAQVQDGILQEFGLAQEDATSSHVSVYHPSSNSSLEQNPGCRALANSLTVFAACLGDMGLREKGLEAIEEAIELCRYLMKNQGMSFMPDLAKSLNVLSERQSSLGRLQEAVRTSEEVVQLQRVLVREDAVDFTPALAHSLNTFSISLSQLGRREEALKAIEEAIQLRRVLVQEHAAAFTPSLASCLNNSSKMLGDMGRDEEALNAIEEAVRLRRVLAQEQPTAFTPELARALGNLSSYLFQRGRREEALNAIEEAVRLRRVLAQEQATAFTPELATSLSNLSTHLAEVGRREEALNVVQEAVLLQRVLVQEQATAFTPVLIDSLNSLSNRWGDMGRREEALKAIEEAVQLSRVLVQEHAAAFTPKLAVVLSNLSVRLGDMGRQEEGLNAAAEAVKLRRSQVQHHAAAFTPFLAESLNHLSIRLRELGRPGEAVKAIEEAVQLQRVLVKDCAAAFTPILADCLDSLSDCLAGMGRRHDALKAIEESVQLGRMLVRNQATAFSPHLAYSLNILSNRLGDVGRAQEGLKASEEAIQLWRMLVQDQAEAFNPDLASSLYNQCYRFSETGRHEEALTSAQEAHDLYGVLAAERPAVFQHQFKNSLERLSQVYAALGQEDESALAARGAEEIETTGQ